MGHLCLLQGIFPTQGLNPGLLNCRWSLYKRNHKGSPRKNTRVGILFLLQWIFLIQESVRGLLHCRQILYHQSHQGSPRILERVAFPFSRESSQPKDQTQVSCIAGRFFTTRATREAQEYWSGYTVPSPVDLPDPGIEPGSPALQVDSLPTELSEKL